MQENYTENFVQCILSAMEGALAGCTLVVGGDGRYFGKEAVNIIIKMCAANGVSLSYQWKNANNFVSNCRIVQKRKFDR